MFQAKKRLVMEIIINQVYSPPKPIDSPRKSQSSMSIKTKLNILPLTKIMTFLSQPKCNQETFQIYNMVVVTGKKYFLTKLNN